MTLETRTGPAGTTATGCVAVAPRPRPGVWLRGLIAAAVSLSFAAPAAAEVGAYLVFDAKTGEVYSKHNADQAWYPASITKLMTAYVTFHAIRSGRLKMTSPVIMSPAANAQPPSKMGFPNGTVITVDNAMKIIMVKSANDVAWALGEAVGGSKTGFVAEMNRHARRLGMTETNWGNPNGLPDAAQVTTARDLGILAVALLREFPEYDYYYRLPGIQLGNRIVRNHNHLIDHYPGTDGMKTGFICASGFNVVASATRDGRKVIAVVLGASGAWPRAERTADLFNRAFAATSPGNLFGFVARRETLDSMPRGPEATQPVRDIRKDICGGKHRDDAQDDAPDDYGVVAQGPQSGTDGVILGGQVTPLQKAKAKGSFLTARFDIGQPVKIWLGGADSIGTRTALVSGVPDAPLVAPPGVVPRQPLEKPSNASALVAPEPTRAPGAILPLRPTKPGAKPQQAATQPTSPQAATAPLADDTEAKPAITRAFTLFPSQAPDEAPEKPAVPGTVSLPGDEQPMALSTPEPKAKPTRRADPVAKLPVPKAKPPETRRTAQVDPKKPVKPATETPKAKPKPTVAQ